MNRYCESLMGSFSQTSNESWFPRHDGINDQLRVCVRCRGFPVIHRLGTAAWQLGNRYCEFLWVTWQTVSPLAVMHYVVLAFTFPRSYLWMLPCCFVPFSVLMSAFPTRSVSESTVQWLSQRESTFWWFLRETKICHWSWSSLSDGVCGDGSVLCFCLQKNFCLCYFTPLFNYESWFYPSWWVVGVHQLQWEGLQNHGDMGSKLICESVQVESKVSWYCWKRASELEPGKSIDSSVFSHPGLAYI